MPIINGQNPTVDSSQAIGGVGDAVTADTISGYTKAPFIHTGTAQGGTATRIQLATTASSTDGAYDPARVYITAGTGAGQSRRILEYDGTNRFAYIDRDFKTLPDNTSVYAVVEDSGDTSVNEGLAQGGAAASITLNTLASSVNNAYQGQMVFIRAGTGADQSRMVVSYNGTTKVATIDGNWVTQPDNTSLYVILPFPGFVHGLPAQNSTGNVLIRDGVGNKNDFIGVPYNFGDNSILAHLNTTYYHVHGQAFVYPTLANNVTLTAGSGVWDNTGAITEVIPANALSVAAFDLHWIEISNISGIGTIEIEIFKGASGSEVKIGSARANRTTNQARNGPQAIQIPQQVVNERISCRLSDSTAGALTCEVSFAGHYYA